MSTFLWMLLNNSVHAALWSFEIGQNQTVQGRNIWHFCVSGINTPSLFFMAVVSPTEGTEGQIAPVQLPTLWGLGPQLPLVAGLQWWGWGLLGMYRWDIAFFWSSWPKTLFQICCSLWSWHRKGHASIWPPVRGESSPGSLYGSRITLSTILLKETLSQVVQGLAEFSNSIVNFHPSDSSTAKDKELSFSTRVEHVWSPARRTNACSKSALPGHWHHLSYG